MFSKVKTWRAPFYLFTYDGGDLLLGQSVQELETPPTVQCWWLQRGGDVVARWVLVVQNVAVVGDDTRQSVVDIVAGRNAVVVDMRAGDE
mmetsp:Transcript_5012/g.8893  ORF Transcript_5012/g.8893 Transcript_5012/m.8893 type:complete len:90 (-) Transcript_5012:24-293(-)|eukprot:CAMPEP_0178863182 /NCGR_PEP_ID=MMETSP0747-20121128/3211_1 /TAXON_ID=913974 /ORGANISM="Nitzschia punctata, Strain CCMP561" /LENGTH=89 /DNA_ID=CAMNT_0020529827 /DNA_START=94 /DNA_END=363 /DNA_ORIENTATION=+